MVTTEAPSSCLLSSASAIVEVEVEVEVEEANQQAVSVSSSSSDDDGKKSTIVAAADADADADAPPSTAIRRYVDHSYTNYANVDEDDLRLTKDAARGRGRGRGGGGGSGGNGNGGANCDAKTSTLLDMQCSYGPMKNKGQGGSVSMPFPGKLMEVLDRGDLASVIDWMPHGRAFIVKRPQVFAVQILPRFFRQTKFLSFTRQLNLWGFKRITRGLDAGAYYHELFLPGRYHLAMRMRRRKIKGTGARPMPCPEREPNFYRDHKWVPRAPASREPLPPLPGERAAETAVQRFLPPQGAGANGLGESPAGLGGLRRHDGTGAVVRTDAASVASSTAEQVCLRGPANLEPPLPDAYLSPRSGGIRHHANAAALFAPSLALSSASFRDDRPIDGHRVACAAPGSLRMGREAPRRFCPRSDRASEDTNDEISHANRRLMERLTGRAAGNVASLAPPTARHTQDIDVAAATSALREARRIKEPAGPWSARQAQDLNMSSAWPAKQAQDLNVSSMSNAGIWPAAPERQAQDVNMSSAWPHAQDLNVSSMSNAGIWPAAPERQAQDATFTNITAALRRHAQEADVARSVTNALREARRLEKSTGSWPRGPTQDANVASSGTVGNANPWPAGLTREATMSSAASACPWPAAAPTRQTQDANMASVANALREAHRLEDLARDRRAQALAGALRQDAGPVGYDVAKYLLPYLGTFGRDVFRP